MSEYPPEPANPEHQELQRLASAMATAHDQGRRQPVSPEQEAEQFHETCEFLAGMAMPEAKLLSLFVLFLRGNSYNTPSQVESELREFSDKNCLWIPTPPNIKTYFDSGLKRIGGVTTKAVRVGSPTQRRIVDGYQLTEDEGIFAVATGGWLAEWSLQHDHTSLIRAFGPLPNSKTRFSSLEARVNALLETATSPGGRAEINQVTGLSVLPDSDLTHLKKGGISWLERRLASDERRQTTLRMVDPAWRSTASYDKLLRSSQLTLDFLGQREAGEVFTIQDLLDYVLPQLETNPDVRRQAEQKIRTAVNKGRYKGIEVLERRDGAISLVEGEKLVMLELANLVLAMHRARHRGDNVWVEAGLQKAEDIILDPNKVTVLLNKSYQFSPRNQEKAEKQERIRQIVAGSSVPLTAHYVASEFKSEGSGTSSVDTVRQLLQNLVDTGELRQTMGGLQYGGAAMRFFDAERGAQMTEVWRVLRNKFDREIAADNERRLRETATLLRATADEAIGMSMLLLGAESQPRTSLQLREALQSLEGSSNRAPSLRALEECYGITLAEAGLVTVHPADPEHGRHDPAYELTEAGLAALPKVGLVLDWGRRHRFLSTQQLFGPHGTADSVDSVNLFLELFTSPRDSELVISSLESMSQAGRDQLEAALGARALQEWLSHGTQENVVAARYVVADPEDLNHTRQIWHEFVAQLEHGQDFALQDAYEFVASRYRATNPEADAATIKRKLLAVLHAKENQNGAAPLLSSQDVTRISIVAKHQEAAQDLADIIIKMIDQDPKLLDRGRQLSKEMLQYTYSVMTLMYKHVNFSPSREKDHERSLDALADIVNTSQGGITEKAISDSMTGKAYPDLPGLTPQLLGRRLSQLAAKGRLDRMRSKDPSTGRQVWHYFPVSRQSRR